MIVKFGSIENEILKLLLTDEEYDNLLKTCNRDKNHNMILDITPMKVNNINVSYSRFPKAFITMEEMAIKDIEYNERRKVIDEKLKIEVARVLEDKFEDIVKGANEIISELENIVHDSYDTLRDLRFDE